MTLDLGFWLRRGWSGGLLTQLASIAEMDHLIDLVVHSQPPMGSSEESLHANHTWMSFVSFQKYPKLQTTWDDEFLVFLQASLSPMEILRHMLVGRDVRSHSCSVGPILLQEGPNSQEQCVVL